MRFDIDAAKRRTGRVEVDDLDFAEFERRPLDPDTLRCLRYMHDVEHHTVCYLRDVLVTDAHRDPDITSFLTFWAWEEYWHGEAIGAVLAAHGESSRERVAETRARTRRHDRLVPLLTMAASRLTRHTVAVHMTWGAINEWTAQAAYGRLSARADHPTLAALLRRLMKQEGRHVDFYASQASDRLGSSAVVQRVTRMALRRFWSPVGAGVMPPTEVGFLAGHLFGDHAGREAMARVDRQIDRLPGLGGMHLVSRAAQAARASAAPTVAEEPVGLACWSAA